MEDRVVQISQSLITPDGDLAPDAPPVLQLHFENVEIDAQLDFLFLRAGFLFGRAKAMVLGRMALEPSDPRDGAPSPSEVLQRFRLALAVSLPV